MALKVVEGEVVTVKETEVRQRQRPKRCATCRFFEKTTENEGSEGFGECRRFPPMIPAVEERDGDSSEVAELDAIYETGEVITNYPLVFGSHDWCGEWKAPKKS